MHSFISSYYHQGLATACFCGMLYWELRLTVIFVLICYNQVAVLGILRKQAFHPHYPQCTHGVVGSPPLSDCLC